MALLLTCGMADAASAQVSSPAVPPDGIQATQGAAPVDTGDIVVTAQKRAENVQNVPIAVQVVNSRELVASGVRNFADLTRV
ncbi:MAG: TonB-dependent receptor, partial [Sphingomonadaceae bacterium]|nr:TonB-dependent receptor [Sphingomonadaceae bacterium]